MTRREEAITHFNEGYNCCKSVVSTYAPYFELSSSTREHMLVPYRHLLGHPDELCGAVAGSVRVLQLALKDRNDCDKLISEFRDRFIEQNGSVSCSGLLGCDLSTYEGRFRQIEQNLCETHCVKYVADAIDLIESLISLETPVS